MKLENTTQIKKILETERLYLREFDLGDSDFILELVNSPKWLEFIGDRNIKTTFEAKEYLKNGLLKGYKENGYGLWMVVLKGTDIPIGMCGLVNREILEDIDIGFAMLPEYLGLGYGFEIASATVRYAINNLKLNKIVAITNTDNIASIKLLNKIGLHFEKTLNLSKNDNVLLFSTANKNNDESEINQLTARFFDVFSTIDGKKPDIKKIEDMFLSNGMLTSNTHGIPEIYNVKEFIASREKILNDGTLIDFSENEILHKTKIYRNVAQRFCFYEKSGKLNKVSFESRGMKTIQFIKTEQKWKISSVAWSDEV